MSKAELEKIEWNEALSVNHPLLDQQHQTLIGVINWMVDSINGGHHLKYAAMPNTMYVIRPDGTVHYRCNWATAEGLREALSDRENLHTMENADVKSLKASRGVYTSLRTMWTGGFLALIDFVKAGPQLAKRHKLVDDYYKKHGKFKQQPN